MASLFQAWTLLNGTLKPQKQGSCGLYSFWYATLLLSGLDSTRRPIVYPRNGEGVAAGVGENPESLRHFAKATVGSAQGEILTCAEMERIVLHYGYDRVSHIGDAGRATFITTSLASERPVLIPYMMGPGGPIAVFPGGARPGVDYGPHWSLIFAESAIDYYLLEPNSPNTPMEVPKGRMLRSNAFTDNFKYQQFYDKALPNPTLPYHRGSGISASPAGTTAAKYDLGSPLRQTLANVLIAVM